MRIDLSVREATLPLTVRGTDHDLKFDASDMLVQSRILEMFGKFNEYREEGLKRDKGETTEAQIQSLNDYVDEGIELCHKLNDTMSDTVDGWAEIFPRTPLNLGFWGDVLSSLIRSISKAEVNTKVTQQMEGER